MDPLSMAASVSPSEAAVSYASEVSDAHLTPASVHASRILPRSTDLPLPALENSASCAGRSHSRAASASPPRDAGVASTVARGLYTPTNHDLMLRRQIELQNGLLVALCEKVVGLEARVQHGVAPPGSCTLEGVAQQETSERDRYKEGAMSRAPAFTMPLDEKFTPLAVRQGAAVGGGQQLPPAQGPDAVSPLVSLAAMRMLGPVAVDPAERMTHCSSGGGPVDGTAGSRGASPARLTSLSRTVEGLNGLIYSTLGVRTTASQPTAGDASTAVDTSAVAAAAALLADVPTGASSGSAAATDVRPMVMTSVPMVNGADSRVAPDAISGGVRAAALQAQLASILNELPDGAPRQRLEDICAQLGTSAGALLAMPQPQRQPQHAWDGVEAEVEQWQQKVEALDALLGTVATPQPGSDHATAVRTALRPHMLSHAQQQRSGDVGGVFDLSDIADQAAVPQAHPATFPVPPAADVHEAPAGRGGINLERPSEARFRLQAHADKLTEILAMGNTPPPADARPLPTAPTPSAAPTPAAHTRAAAPAAHNTRGPHAGAPTPQRRPGVDKATQDRGGKSVPYGVIDSPDPATAPLTPMSARREEPVASPVASPPPHGRGRHGYGGNAAAPPRRPAHGLPDYAPGPGRDPSQVYKPLQRHAAAANAVTSPSSPRGTVIKQVHDRLAYLSRHIDDGGRGSGPAQRTPARSGAAVGGNSSTGVLPISEYASSDQMRRVQRFRERRSRNPV